MLPPGEIPEKITSMGWDKDSIRKLRKDLRLTQVEFALRLGCRQQTVSEWEQGLYEPANAYRKLLDFFSRDELRVVSSLGSTQKRVSSFSLPKVKVPEVFREEIGIPPDQEASDSERPFDPAVD